jgi:MerR family redox-sensitive transcriptional activator SoxR
VRFYEAHGLITSERTTGNQRRFYEVTACVVKVIRVAQRVGLSIAEIRELTAELPEPRDFTMNEWFGLRQRLEDEVKARIQSLNEVLDDLTSESRLCEVPTA